MDEVSANGQDVGDAAATAVVPAANPDSVLNFFDPSGIGSAILVVLVAFAVARLSGRGIASLSERFASRRLVIKQVGTFLSFAIYGVTVLVCVVLLFDFSSETIFALSGGAAVTIGFALKDVAASFLASITVLATKPFQVGDRVAFAGYYGEVTDIGLRSVRLVTLDDNLVTIPSNKFLTDAVANANAGALDCMVMMPFYVDANSDLEKAKEIVQDAVLASRYLYLGKPFVVLLSTEMSNQGTVYIKLNAKAYVYDARHEKAFLSDVTEQVIAWFRREHIRMPSISTGAIQTRIG